MIFPSLIRIVENRISRRTRNDDRDNGREKREGGVAGKWKRTERMGDGMFRMTNVAIWYEQRDSLEFKKKKNKNTDTEIRESDDKGSIERDIRFYFFFFFLLLGSFHVDAERIFALYPFFVRLMLPLFSFQPSTMA